MSQLKYIYIFLNWKPDILNVKTKETDWVGTSEQFIFFYIVNTFFYFCCVIFCLNDIYLNAILWYFKFTLVVISWILILPHPVNLKFTIIWHKKCIAHECALIKLDTSITVIYKLYSTCLLVIYKLYSTCHSALMTW